MVILDDFDDLCASHCRYRGHTCHARLLATRATTHGAKDWPRSQYGGSRDRSHQYDSGAAAAELPALDP
jgi:hypothetical protein